MTKTSSPALTTDIEVEWAGSYRVAMRPLRGKRTYWVQARTPGAGWTDVRGPLSAEMAHRELERRANHEQTS